MRRGPLRGSSVRPGRARRRAAPVVAAIVYLTLAPAAGQEPAPPPIDLDRSAPHVDEIRPGESRSFTLRLSAGEHVRVVVEHRGIDLLLRLFDPAGDLLREVDREYEGTEEVREVAPEEGRFRLEVEAFAGAGPAAPFTIRVEDLRPASEADRDLVLAERGLEEGYRVSRAADRESLTRAVALYADAAERFERLGETEKLATVLNNRAHCLRMLGDHAAAGSEMERVLALRVETGDRGGQGIALNNLGTFRASIGALREGIDDLQRALALRLELADRRGEAFTRGNLGFAFQNLGEYHAALEEQRRALEIWRELEDVSGEATALSNLGVLHWRLGDVERAEALSRRAAELFRAAGNRRGEAMTLQSVARCQRDRGQTSEARELLDRALALAREVGDGDAEAKALDTLGALLLWDLGEPSGALEALTTALDLARSRRLRLLEAVVLNKIGQARQFLDEREAAAAAYRRAVEIAGATSARETEAEALYHLADLLVENGNLEGARATIERGLSLVEDLRASVAGPEMREGFLRTKARHYELYVEILMRLHRRQPQAGHDAEALGASEMARGRVLIELLAEAGVDLRRGVPESLLAREREVRETMNEEAYRVRRLASEAEPSPEELEAARDALDAAASRFREIEAEIRGSSPAWSALARPRPLTPAEIRREVIEPGTVLVVYSLGERGSWMWVVHPGGLSSFALPPREEIEASVREVHDLLSRPQGRLRQSPGSDATANLGRMLLGPAMPRLGSARLAVVPDGILHYLPFAALPVPSREGETTRRPLIADREVVVLPSASAPAALRSRAHRRRPPEPRITIFADPVYAPDDPRVAGRAGSQDARPSPARGVEMRRLPATRRESEAIAALAPDRTTQVTGFDATRERVLDPSLARSRYLHFAVHGILDSRNPALSGIAMSLFDRDGNPLDGFLRLHEIFQLELDADLVVLSACRTALGAEIRGEGIVGLTQGMFHAGPPRLLATLWDVDDASTADLMQRFYAALLNEGMTASGALRAAQAEMWRAGRAPYAWAGVIFLGDWRAAASAAAPADQRTSTTYPAIGESRSSAE